MPTEVKHLKTKKDKSICNLRRMHNLSCNGCVCYSACYGDYELYSGDNVYLITANIFKLLSNESKTAEHVAQVTGLNVNKVGLYRQIIKKGDYKDVRKTGAEGMAYEQCETAKEEKCSKKSTERKGRA